MTSETRFTPGPWEVAPHYMHSGATYTWDVRAKATGLVAQAIVIYPGGFGLTTLEADARLIAAAPDLYAALRVALANLRMAQINSEAFDAEENDPEYQAAKTAWDADIAACERALTQAENCPPSCVNAARRKRHSNNQHAQESNVHTKDILAAELNKIGLGDMAIRAAQGYYHDYLSPLATPCIQLATDLLAVGTPEARALHDRHVNGEFDANKEEGDEWFKAEGRDHIMSAILDNKAGGRMTPEPDKANWQPKPSRALKPDAQPFDRIEIVTVPRYKQSELSGDEWRIHADIIFYRKGREVHRVGMGKVEYAAGVVYAKMLEAMDNGLAFYAGEDDICDQEGCAEKATWRHEMKAKYDNSANKSEPREGGEYRLFCDRHKTRGDCGYEDGDDNYIVTPFIAGQKQ